MRKVRIPYLLPLGLAATVLLTSCGAKHATDAEGQPPKPANAGKSLEQLYNEYPCEGSPICGRHAVLYSHDDKATPSQDENKKFIGAIPPPIPVGKEGDLKYNMFVFPQAKTFDEMRALSDDNGSTPISQTPFPDLESAVGFQKKLNTLVETAREVVAPKGGNPNATAGTMTKVADTLIDASDPSAPIAAPTLDSMINAIKGMGAPANEFK